MRKIKCNIIKPHRQSRRRINGQRGEDGLGAIIPFSQGVPGSEFGGLREYYIGFINTNIEEPLLSSEYFYTLYITPRHGILSNLTVSVDIISFTEPDIVTVSIKNFASTTLLTTSSSYSTTGMIDLPDDKSKVVVGAGEIISISIVKPINSSVVVMGSFTFA